MDDRCLNEESAKEIELQCRTLVHTKDDFEKGIFEGTRLNDNKEVILKKDIRQGFYISPTIKSKGFKEIVASWNCRTPKNTKTELFIKVKKDEKWSTWFSYGKWSIEDERKSVKGQQDEIASMNIDTLVLSEEKEATVFKYKILLYRDSTDIVSPEVKLVAASLKLSKKDKSIKTLVKQDELIKDIDVPKRAQLVIPEIGNKICSPTSVSMIMEYYGIKIGTIEAAELVKDTETDIYGNWSFNVAFVGSRELYAYVDRFETMDEMKNMIERDIPVIASIKTESKEELEGSIMPYPGGHLLVVRGFLNKDGEEYVIVNDPAANDVNDVRREYKVEEFVKVWRNIVYIITPNI